MLIQQKGREVTGTGVVETGKYWPKSPNSSVWRRIQSQGDDSVGKMLGYTSMGTWVQILSTRIKPFWECESVIQALERWRWVDPCIQEELVFRITEANKYYVSKSWGKVFSPYTFIQADLIYSLCGWFTVLRTNVSIYVLSTWHQSKPSMLPDCLGDWRWARFFLPYSLVRISNNDDSAVGMRIPLLCF